MKALISTVTGLTKLVIGEGFVDGLRSVTVQDGDNEDATVGTAINNEEEQDNNSNEEA